MLSIPSLDHTRVRANSIIFTYHLGGSVHPLYGTLIFSLFWTVFIIHGYSGRVLALCLIISGLIGSALSAVLCLWFMLHYLVMSSSSLPVIMIVIGVILSIVILNVNYISGQMSILFEFVAILHIICLTKLLHCCILLWVWLMLACRVCQVVLVMRNCCFSLHSRALFTVWHKIYKSLFTPLGLLLPTLMVDWSVCFSKKHCSRIWWRWWIGESHRIKLTAHPFMN